MGLTAIALTLRQEVSEIDFDAMTTALQGHDPLRVAAALSRCGTELLFLPKPKEVIDRLPHLEISNKRPDLKLVRDFYESYSSTLRLRVFEYEGKYRQVRLEKIQAADR